ncbi:MAG TPA: response regulator [Candidatus Paceibacterota bacterium]
MSVAAQRQKILIIESNGAFGEQLRDTLAAATYDVVLVKEPLHGLQSIIDTLPHLVIIDAALRGADVYDILAKKQAEPMLIKIPVLIISNESVPIHINRVPANCPAEFMSSLKLTPADILQKVNRRFSKSASATPMTTSDASPRKVLWVEDDKLIGTILSKKLTTSGFGLMHAKNGEEALEMLKTAIPDAIVLDLVLPGMGGFDILQQIKKDGALSKVPVMILSNLSRQSDIERAKSLGAQKFLVKASVSLDEIVKEVRGLCQ